ncbi:hypothetical protein [Arthrobacter sp. AZCC_0090]|uniref:hypothetical protein n=1 Tax=Arthrobacter sp. AZCC_0090 TaxID=2735881 RepID=UPI0016112C8E|nr:hypothetical protein [Arthrobacter sp. AZCC_0090]MBB6406281.1 hypothetical protein [Arthrobacter sp. AZCC_0090]
MFRGGDREQLEALTREVLVGDAGAAGQDGAAGLPNVEIEKSTGFKRPTVLKWRLRYATAGVEGLSDAPQAGPGARDDELAIVVDTDQ